MSDLRTQMIRMASDLPVGDPTRRKLLAAVQSKKAAGVADYTTLTTFIYRPGATEVTIMVKFWMRDVLDDGMWVDHAAKKLTDLGNQVPKHLDKLTKGLAKYLENSPDTWSLPAVNGRPQYSVKTELTLSSARYMTTGNVIADTRYVRVRMKDPSAFDYDTFNSTLRNVANLFGVNHE
ncbi:hypothetical protein N9917_00245 [Deltaproteobacteria bacterium]|nr:hypothetical protein [Deltaproteobacteria bacterium]